MYKPLFNSVLVEIDDKDAKWGTGNDDAVLSQSYRMGTVVNSADTIVLATNDYPLHTPTYQSDISTFIIELQGKQVMWNEGHEAGTVFEENGKQYAFIYWWDIRACKG